MVWRYLLAVGLVLGTVWMLAQAARSQLEDHPERRAWFAVGGVVACAAGAWLAFWLPHRVPETSGSPASLVLILVLWLMGGALIALGVGMLGGTVLAGFARR
jgi:uncharacterized membrane protein YedE/YeeE